MLVNERTAIARMKENVLFLFCSPCDDSGSLISQKYVWEISCICKFVNLVSFKSIHLSLPGQKITLQGLFWSEIAESLLSLAGMTNAYLVWTIVIFLILHNTSSYSVVYLYDFECYYIVNKFSWVENSIYYLQHSWLELRTAFRVEFKENMIFKKFFKRTTIWYTL